MEDEALKAREIVNGFLMLTNDNYGIDYAKECAKFSVELIQGLDSGDSVPFYFWEEVKNQIDLI